MPSWKNVTITIGDDSVYAADAADKIIAKMRTYNDIGYQETINKIFFTGMTKEQVDMEHQDPAVQNLLNKHKLAMRMKKEIDRQKSLKRGYVMFGAERFMEMAFEEGLDLDEVESLVKQYNMKEVSSWYEKVKRWLVATLNTEGQISVKVIRERAIARGLLADPSSDPDEHKKQWDSIKVCASELGASSKNHRGYWRSVADEISLENLPIQ